MALTSITTPSDYNSAYRPVVWRVETGVASLAAVKFELNDSAPSVVNSFTTQHIYGNTDQFEIDFRSVIQDYYPKDITNLTTSGTVITSSGIGQQFDVKATERILSGGIYSNGATLTSSGFYILNTALEVGEALTGYFTTASGCKVLSNTPTYTTRSNEGLYVGLFANDEGLKVTVIATDTTGATVTGVSSVVANTGRFAHVGIGYQNVNKYGLSSGSQPLLDNMTASYTVQIESQTTPITYELLSVEVDREHRPNAVQFAFLNKFGAFDFFTAYSYKDFSRDIESKMAMKPIENYESITDYGTFKTSNISKQIYRVGSQNLTNDLVLWLQELFTSTQVYIVESEQYRPVTIVNNSVSFESSRQGSEVFSLTFDYEFATELIRQRQ